VKPTYSRHAGLVDTKSVS